MKRTRSQEPASTSVDLLALRECVERFTTKTIVLLGDFVADEFQYGEISRVSREAPVLIVNIGETQIVPGGGANAANNLASLGARVLPVTAVGNDAAGDALIAHFRCQGVSVSGIVRVKGWTTPYQKPLSGWLGAHRGTTGSARGRGNQTAVAADGAFFEPRSAEAISVRSPRAEPVVPRCAPSQPESGFW